MKISPVLGNLHLAGLITVAKKFIFEKRHFIKAWLNLQSYTSLVKGSVQLAICFDTIIKKINSEKRLTEI